jgi:hypothetical protein
MARAESKGLRGKFANCCQMFHEIPDRPVDLCCNAVSQCVRLEIQKATLA